MPLDPKGYPLNWAILPRQGVIAALLIHRNEHREAAKVKEQRNMAQMKEQMKTPEKELNKMEISNQSDEEFKTLVIRMLKELSEDLVKNEGYTN